VATGAVHWHSGAQLSLSFAVRLARAVTLRLTGGAARGALRIEHELVRGPVKAPRILRLAVRSHPAPVPAAPTKLASGSRLPVLLSPTPAASAPLPMTMRRLAVAPAEPTSHQPTRSATPDATLPAPAWQATWRTSPARGDVVDVGRLTEQVLHRIDRRIVAERERLGRV
jgi:hypothetical protein